MATLTSVSKPTDKQSNMDNSDSSLSFGKYLTDRSDTEWAKIGAIKRVSFVGQNCICIASGCHIIFVNLTTGDKSLYTANNPRDGDGISCYVGHSYSQFLAFAEKCSRPAVIVMHYPSFERQVTLDENIVEGYMALTFGQTSLLIALTNLPSFKLIVWNWIVGVKLAVRDTDLLDSDQITRSNLVKPLCFVQWGKTTNKLILWDTFLSGKKCVLNPHWIKSPVQDKFDFEPTIVTGVTWNTENILLNVTDQRGHIYVVNPEYRLEKIISCDTKGPYLRRITWVKNGITAAGPDNKIRHYVKSASGWNCVWEMVPDPEDPVILLSSNKIDILIGLSKGGKLVKIPLDGSSVDYVTNNESKFNNICMIYPSGEHIVALCRNTELNVYATSTGEMICKKLLGKNALQIAENPELPYIAVSYDNGMLELYSLYNLEVITFMAAFHLTRNPLDSIYFCEFGRVIVTANVNIGEFFIIEGTPGSHMQVVASVSAGLQVADYILAASRSCYRLFVIPVTSNNFIAGNKIIRYCVVKNRTTNIKEYEFVNNNVLYHKLHATPHIDRDRIFYAIPLKLKQIHLIETKRGDDFARVIKKFPTGHQFAKFQLHIDKHHALTWSNDGLIFVRNTKLTEFIEVTAPHHRLMYGVKKAYVTPSGKYVVSLGNDNLLTCTDLLKIEVDRVNEKALRSLSRSHTYGLMFSKKTTGFMPTGNLAGKTWLEVEELNLIEIERIRCLKKKNNILEEFRKIKEQLSELLTENLKGPENEVLNMLEFNLDKRNYAKRVEENKLECKKTDVYLRFLIMANNRVRDYLKMKFWDSMRTPGRSIYAIHENFCVTNYTLLPENQKLHEHIEWLLEKRNFYYELIGDDNFYPWSKYSEKELQEVATKTKTMKAMYQRSGLRLMAQGEADEGSKAIDGSNTILAFTGSIASHFIELFPMRYSQRALQTFFQYHIHCRITEVETEKLRSCFNKEFDAMMDSKIKELSIITRKNARLRHIISEINYFSENKLAIIVDDPEWRQEENPDELAKVENNEVSITPYISPSEQAILDAEAAEAERIRLLLLADDFRERALMAMMNGVLEVRWEDELKKEVPLPKCMIDKDPATFNEEDLRAVRDYEEKVKFLDSERQRYKHLLHGEYSKISSQLRDGIRKFNKKLGDLLLTKMKIQTAIDQEYLKMNRIKLKLIKRKQLDKNESEVKKKNALNDQQIHDLQEIIQAVQPTLIECRQYYESLALKEKYLERLFKRDLLDSTPVVMELCLKLYKKRPKIQSKAITSQTALLTLAKSLITHDMAMTLTPDCFEFLKALDAMDQYSCAPPLVDEPTWNVMCKHRRAKIEYEVKVRCASLSVSEAEQTLSLLHKILLRKKELSNNYITQLNQIRTERLNILKNVELQVVVNAGRVEVTLNGNITDFDDAILVSEAEVVDVNKHIVRAGDSKLKAMRQTMNFKRRISAMEWEHRRMRMYIEDLQVQLRDIEETQVTKEMQQFLKNKGRGLQESPLNFETEVDLLKISFENSIKEMKDQYAKIKGQIKALQERNQKLDKEIANVNVDLCEFNLERDTDFEEREQQIVNERMAGLINRTKLVQQIQENHNEILVLQTELELLRLRTYPTLKFKLCHD